MPKIARDIRTQLFSPEIYFTKFHDNKKKIQFNRTGYRQTRSISLNTYSSFLYVIFKQLRSENLFNFFSIYILYYIVSWYPGIQAKSLKYYHCPIFSNNPYQRENHTFKIFCITLLFFFQTIIYTIYLSYIDTYLLNI